MMDTVTIRRKTGEAVDPTTFVVTLTYTTIYSGPGFASALDDGSNTVERGDSRTTTLKYTVGVPIEGNDTYPNPNFREGDECTLPTPLDPEMVGRVIILEGPVPGTFAVYRRMTGYTEQRFNS